MVEDRDINVCLGLVLRLRGEATGLRLDAGGVRLTDAASLHFLTEVRE